jgi:hypothetical protein
MDDGSGTTPHAVSIATEPSKAGIIFNFIESSPCVRGWSELTAPPTTACSPKRSKLAGWT